MEMRIIDERIKSYAPSNREEELNAFKEVAQEIVLSALSRAEFFKYGAFQGGTALRILHGLSRFSEDLDFVLFSPDATFEWKTFFQEIKLEFNSFGFELEAKDRSKADDVVKKAFLKQKSFGQVLKLQYERSRADTQVVTIKLEVDTNPPKGSTFESKIVTFPEPFSIVAQDLPSLFSGKLHALLCRDYVKGRDWFDFIWYVARQTPVNFQQLQNALEQQGPWRNSNITVDARWVLHNLASKVEAIDWDAARRDVQQFVRLRQRRSLELWSRDYLNSVLEAMSAYTNA